MQTTAATDGASFVAHHVHGLWMVREEVHDAPALLDVVLRVGLQGMHHVRELHAVPHEEHLQTH